MSNIEKNINSGDYPLRGTMEGLGVKPDYAEENKAESGQLSYRDIGEERLAKATERVRHVGKNVSGFMSRRWGKIKSFGSKTKEAGKSALIYALASPDMIRDANTKMQEGVIEGINYIGDKASEGISYVADKADEYVDIAKEAGVATAGRVFEEAVYVSDKAKEKYQNIMNAGREKYVALQERANDARAVFQAAVEEARRRKAERIARSQEMQNHPEYASAMEALQNAQRRLDEVKSKLGGREEAEGLAA